MEDEFRRLWRDGVAELARQLPDATIRLFRDTEHPGRFHSIGGPASETELGSVRESEWFRRAMAAIADVIENVEVSAYELVEEAG